MRNYPRLKVLGPIMLGRPYHAKSNPLLFNLVHPGHPKHQSSISLATYIPIKAREVVMDMIVKGAY